MILWITTGTLEGLNIFVATKSYYLGLDGHCKGGSRILKWGVNFCNNVREIKYYFNIWGIRKKKKEGGSEKWGWKFTHFTSPGSAPALVLVVSFCSLHLRNRKHVPCFYQVIKTPVEVWENENTSRRRMFPQLIWVLSQTFTRSVSTTR